MTRPLLPLTLLAALLCAGPATLSAQAPADCWRQSRHGRIEEAYRCFETLTRSPEAAVRAEGLWGLGEWEDANQQFRIAAGQAGAEPLTKVRWGLLLNERFNPDEARDLFREALAKDPRSAGAYIGLARVSSESFDGQAGVYLAKAIEIDPRLAQPHELLAGLALENDDRETAAAEADRAIALEPDALDAMATRAALEVLADRPPEAWIDRIRAINPRYGEGYAQVAHQLEMHYRFEDAVSWYRRAVEADPRLWSAHSALGIALMRLGKEDEPRQELELSYNNGYRDKATVNSLRLLDSYGNFDTIRDQTTILKLNRSEAPLLALYLQPELHTILAAYEKKYRMRLPGPVQVELYPDHEDFAVRTMGMPGLGALGVTFGSVVSMDSPSARRPGDFNWGATLWHEMSHVFILNATRQRVPRWFTEGLAVHEEGERSPEWANRLSPEVLVAIRDKRLLPVERLDRGFVYPDYPSQVIVSYFQAGAVCQFIKERWSEEMLLNMVHSYAASRTTPQAIRENLGIEPEEFDRRLLAWIDQRYGAEARSFDQWRTALRALATALRDKQYDAVLGDGAKVIDLYPEYVDEASAYEAVAAANRAKGDARAEEAALTAYRRRGGQMPEVLKRLAALEDAAGEKDEAAATLARLNYIYPVKDEELHRRLGDLLYAAQQYDGAVREYRALVASNPVDKAGAEYSLAEAYLAANQRDKAEESVLAALEAAPGFRPAQRLLLQLQQSPPTPK